MSGSSKKATAAQFKCVKIFLTDVDGVLTDGSVVLDGKTEFKQFNVQDGMGLRLLQHLGIPVGWVSNRESAATTARAKELKVDYLWQKSLPKVAAIEAILKKAKITWADACYVSDDLNDLAVLVKVGLPVAVADAQPDVKRAAKYITKAKGGDGAVRGVCDRIIRAHGKWNVVIARLKQPKGYRDQ